MESANETELRDTYDRIAADWIVDHARDTWWQEGLADFTAMIAPGGRILDVGCGGGDKANFLANEGFSTEGADLSPEMVRLARERFRSLKFTVASFFDLAGFTAQFDGVLAAATLLHAPKARAGEAIAQMASCLKPGGILLVSVKERGDGQPEEEIKVERDYGYDYSRLFSYYSAEELHALFGEAGLAVEWEKATLSGRTVWLQVAGRKP